MNQKLFTYASAYYLICGLSGLLAPTSWYTVAGLSPELPGLLVRITGAALLALCIGCWRARRYPAEQTVVILMCLAANFFDLIAIGFALVEQELPFGPGIGFVLVDIAWLVVFWRALQGTKALKA